MKDLFLSEYRRFRNAALIFAGVHLLIQLFVNRRFDLLQKRWENHLLIAAVYMLAGLAFALVQFGSYRRPSRWLWLLHRPLPPAAIFGGIGLASGALIAFAVGLPVLLAVAGTDLLSARTVDSRHYLLVLQAVTLTACAWLGGSYVILNRSRSAAVVLLLPLFLLVHLASGTALLLPSALCLGLLAYIALCTFKPDRLAPLTKASAVICAAAPLLLGFYFVLIWGGSLMYQNALIVFGAHPVNIPVPPSGGFAESTRAEGRDLFLRGLAQSSDPRAAQWRRQIPLLDIGNVKPAGHQYPVRHQASNFDPLQWVDGKRHIEWTFSHDAMRFHGRDTRTSQERGWLGRDGIDGSQPFPAVPVLPPGGLIMSPQHLYRFDQDSGEVRPLIALAAPETLALWPKLAAGLLYVITNERLIAYRRPDPGSERAMLGEAFSVALPGTFSNLDRIDVAGLLDGVLVSFSFGREMDDGSGDSAQSIVWVDTAGKAATVAVRWLKHDFHPLFEHHAWWISPALHALHAMPHAVLDHGYILDRGAGSYANRLGYSRPPAVWAAAVLMSLLSAAAAVAWQRRTPASARRKAAWITACLLLGPPALLTLMVLQARPPSSRHRDSPQAVPAAA